MLFNRNRLSVSCVRVLAMVTKILLTVAVIAAVMLYLRSQSGEVQKPAVDSTDAKSLQRSRNWATLVILVLLLGIGGSIFYFKWAEEQRLVTVRVVNSTTEKVTTYNAFANRLHGRTFITEDGRTITLADVERMEVVDPKD